MKSITTSKAALRIKIKNIIKQIPDDVRRQQSASITKKIISSDIYKKSTRISIYLSTDDEVDTKEILQESFKRDKKVFVPTYKGKLMEMLRVYSMTDYDNLPATKWNIKQPKFDDTQRENALLTGGLDLVLLPGMAFTRTGGRLGHGMGYYDKYLHRLLTTADHRAAMIALAFKEQIVDSSALPLAEHDFIIDDVVTSD